MPPRFAGNSSPGLGVDMDWDDEDEATHIFGKDRDSAAAAQRAAAPAAVPNPLVQPRKATLLGITPAPSSVAPSALPPAFTRSSGGSVLSSAPPPPSASVPLPRPPAMPTSLGPTLTVMHKHAVAEPTPTAPRSMEETAVLRPGGKRLPLIIALALASVAIIGAVFYLLSQGSGRLAINVSDGNGGAVTKVDIYVDGKKLLCETTPCLSDLSPGLHEVRVMADGYDQPAVQAIAVQAGKDTTAAFMLMSRSKGTGVKISGTQAGAKLFIDGKEIGPLPQEVRDLPAGDHLVRVSASDRYQPLEKHVTVEDNVVHDLGQVTLKVLHGKATITLGTPGAQVFLVSGSEQRAVQSFPVAVNDIDTTKQWMLVATKPGYEDFSQPVTFDDGQAEKTFNVVLEPKVPGAGAVAAYVPRPAAAAVPPPRGGGGDDTGGGAAPAGGGGFLNINSIPASTIFLDGKSLGTTPKVHVSVPAGTHTVKFVNDDEGLTKTISVNVGAGETKPAVAKLN